MAPSINVPTAVPRVYGAIEGRYEQLGAATSWLGLPLSDEVPFAEGGRVSTFERSAIYWWSDVGPIDLNDVVVQYTGLYCFGETDADGLFGTNPDDEPYVILGAITPETAMDTRSRIYEDIDAGDSQPDLIELYRGKPYGITIPMVLMEHGAEDPEKYRDLMTQAVTAGEKKLADVIAEALNDGVPYVGPVLAVAAESVLPLLIPIVTDIATALLGVDDRQLGAELLQLTAKQMVVLAARTPTSGFWGIDYKVESPLMSHYGATYKVYFGVGAV